MEKKKLRVSTLFQGVLDINTKKKKKKSLNNRDLSVGKHLGLFKPFLPWL